MDWSDRVSTVEGSPALGAPPLQKGPLVPMVGNSGEDGMRSIDLFEGDDKGEFVLKGERAE